jgi:uncharacterized SAM-binding protein YcdF (DUF218 family)
MGFTRPSSSVRASLTPVRRRWLGRLLAGCIIALVLVSAFRWQATLAALGNYLICSQAPQPADLILVLAGDFYGPRVLKAAELEGHGYAPRVVISGAPYHARPEDQVRPEGEFALAFLAKQGYGTDSFESFGHHAHSTIEEAIALRPELERRRVKRVVLVTSAFHSRRALIVFQLVCPRIDFISVPAPDSHYQADRWWTDASSRRLFFSEWSKIVGSLLLAYPEYQLSK